MNPYRLEDFDFELPPERIAQQPLSTRDASRLLVLDRATGRMDDRLFRELPEILRPSDLLVVNESRVIQARLLGRKAVTGGGVEILLIRPHGTERTADALRQAPSSFDWICLAQASKGLRSGESVDFGSDLAAEIVEPLGRGEYRVRFRSPVTISFLELLERIGRVPLPPYIRREPSADDLARYQTVYAHQPGSIAAPTAGLHFTEVLLKALDDRGIRKVPLTLDVGPGTFLPVRVEEVEQHVMHAERFHIPDTTARAINLARKEGQRVVAVGTTVVRTLESATDSESGELVAGDGETSLFIRPGFQFRQVDALITNFHLSRSTLLILVSALAGRELMLSAYRAAVARNYRFFSYGDAMLIV